MLVMQMNILLKNYLVSSVSSGGCGPETTCDPNAQCDPWDYCSPDCSPGWDDS